MNTSISRFLAAAALSMALLPAAGAAPHDPAEFQARAEQRLARQKEALKIMPNQEAAWQAYSDTIRQTMQRPDRPARDASQPVTAPERMSRQIERMKQRTAKMEQVALALQNLYAQLSAEQRVIADQQAARFMRKHRG